MARPKKPIPEAVADTTDLSQIVADQQLIDEASVIRAGYEDERDLVNQLLGQAQMAEAFAKFSKTVLVSKMAFVKENKLYQWLRGKKTQDGLEFSGTWEEFCNLLGWTPEHANESISNLNIFGEEALESMSRMGIGYRELRQFRKLPDDQKIALIEVAKSGDKDSFLDLAEDIIAKHAKEKEVLAKRAEEAEANLTANQEVSDKKTKKIDELETQLAKKKRIPRASPDEEGEEIRQEAGQIAYAAETELRKNLRNAFEALSRHGEEHGISHADFMSGLCCQIVGVIYQLREDFFLPQKPQGDEAPEWLSDVMETKAEG